MLKHHQGNVKHPNSHTQLLSIKRHEFRPSKSVIHRMRHWNFQIPTLKLQWQKIKETVNIQKQRGRERERSIAY